MLSVGKYNVLKVAREVDFGMYLDGFGNDILLPKRYVPQDLKPGDELEVFVYHDNEGRLIATTDRPVAQVGEIASMEVADVTEIGAFLKWGIMKDVFLPISNQNKKARKGEYTLVMLYIDEQTGRVTATEKLDKFLTNYELTVTENEAVRLVVYQTTDIGYKVIINSKHLGVLHYNEVFKELEPGDSLNGFIKAIKPGNKIDVAPGVKGYARVQGDEGKILELLHNNNGYLPYNDKSNPDDIYAFFGMSKKAFKMALGSLYKQRKIVFTQTGTKMAES